MTKMLKKITAAVLAAAMAVCLAGCQKKYEMTEEDLAIQEKLVGFWGADDSTGYNKHDENGYLTDIVVVEFTEDFNQLTHELSLTSGIASTYGPIPYTIEKKDFKVMHDNVPSYAKVSFDEDGKTMYWSTDDRKDVFLRMSEDKARRFGVPVYLPEKKDGE